MVEGVTPHGTAPAMRDELPSLTPHERALLQRFRVDETPSAAVAARVLRNLDALLAAPVSAASPMAWWDWARAGMMSVAIAAGALLVVGGTARVLTPADAAAPLQAEDQAVAPTREHTTIAAPAADRTPTAAEASALPVEPMLEVPIEPSAIEPAAIAPTAIEPGTSKATPKSTRPERGAAKSAPEASAVPNDAAEIALFGEIKRNADASARLASIARYRKSFPKGTFFAEIGVIEIETLCAAGRTEDANARAKDFLVRFGDSAYAAIARRGCQEPSR